MDQVRRATAEDAEGICRVLHKIWNQRIDEEVFNAHLHSDKCGIWVATANGDVAGFVSAFQTCDLNHRGRWEIDLVAVRPPSRGRGLGQRLVCRAWKESERLKLNFSRAFIRVTNAESQRVFQKVGFVTDRRLYILHLWPPIPSNEEVQCSKRVNLIPVDTLTYRGLWIEGLTSGHLSKDDQHRVVLSAQYRISLDSRLNTGAFIPTDELSILSMEVQRESVEHGKYHCWKKVKAEINEVG